MSLIRSRSLGFVAARLVAAAMVMSLAGAAFGSEPGSQPDYEDVLKHMLPSFGERAETLEDFRAALHSKHYVVRYTALRFFTQREGGAFISTLKEFLSDEHLRVRYTAADLLTTLGDRSALEKMRLDFQNLLPPGKTPEDPGDPAGMNLAKLGDALEVGRVLAELGDDRALPLALRAAQHEVAAVRCGAVFVLGRVARDGDTGESARDALEALIRLAAVEQNRVVHDMISAVAIKMEPRSAVRLLDAFSRSPHIPEWLRKVTLERKVEKERELSAAVGAPHATIQAASTTRPAAGSRPVAEWEGGDCFRQLVPNRDAPGQHGMLTDVKLEGRASGGELVLLEIVNPNPRYIRINTQAGEAADAVLSRIAAAIVEGRPFNPHQTWPIRAEGNLLKSFPGAPASYVFAGTETGLGIPPPPTSLTISYDIEHQQVSLSWENPREPYDAIGGSGGRLSGSATTLVRDCPLPVRKIARNERERFNDRRDKGLRRFYVLGCRGGVLSNAAAITWDFDDNSQEELDIQPFTGGVCPNWKAWGYGGESGSLLLEQGSRGEWKRIDQEPRRVLKADEKRFFQWIKTRSPDVIGGVCRKFLGLKDGHTYRVYTRMNTFEMDKAEAIWSFSFHAAAHAKGVTLTPEQMAGAAALPDGSSGSLAGQVAAYGPGETTKGKFEEVSTEKKAGPHGQVDITLPPDAEVITVWFRYHGPPSGGVGFDWIKLKDVTSK